MKLTDNKYCILLAGGKGTRLWPVSNEELPKQFLDFFSVGRTQLQQTYDRMARMMGPEHIYVCTNKRYANLVAEQLPELPKGNILAEPLPRGTAPSVAWGAHRIGTICPEAVVAIVPTDQMIQREEVFCADIERAMQFVSIHDRLLTIGARPTRPETDYGYIQMGQAEEDSDDVCRVQSFTEKPEKEFAELFMQSGEFLWNTGIVVVSNRYLRQVFTEIFPPVLRLLNERGTKPTLEEELQYVEDNYCRYPNMQFDRGVLENRDDVCIMQCHFGWADLGTWHSVHEHCRRSQDDNVLLGTKATLEECRSCVVSLPEGHTALLYGLDDYVVVEKNGVLLVCPKKESTRMARKHLY